MSKIVLITGATAGIGRSTALHLAELGHHVIATGRRVAELATLQAEARGHLDTVQLDVTSPESIASAVTAVDELTQSHGIDVLVNNAGFGLLGPTMEISDAEMRRNYETNVFGLMNVTRAFARKMIDRRSGRIVNVSSIGGRVSMPYLGVYFSTKHALEGLSDALRYELRPFGIDVSLVEPGFTRTNFEATAVQNIDAYASSPYGKALAIYEQMSKRANRFAADPIVISRAIARAVQARRPAARYVAPFTSNFLIAFARLAPQPLVDWTMRTAMRLTPKTLGVDRPQTAN
jgi:short-subunit dehydrogenase